MTENARSVVKELLWIDLCTVIVKEVRNHIVPVDVMLGQAVAQNPMHTKLIDVKLSPTGRKTIAKPALQIPLSLLGVEVTGKSVSAYGTEIGTSTGRLEVAATT